MGDRARAILWAQYRTLINHLPRANRASLVFTAGLGVFWYGSFMALAVTAGILMADPTQLPDMRTILPGALLLAFVYWQGIPLLLVSTGSALDTKKLLAYPIPKGELFGLETLLRLSTGIEVLIVFIGAGVGLLFNPQLPKWGPLALVIFAGFNLFVSIGVRDLLARLFARKIFRELMVLVLVLLAAIPQLLFTTNAGAYLRQVAGSIPADIWPWQSCAELCLGRATPSNITILLGWLLLAYGFGRWQFERSLRFDSQEQNASAPGGNPAGTWMDSFFRLPSRIFPDPVGALVEKELRVLARSPRFRLVFLMGFSFGLLIWLPVTFGRGSSPDSWMPQNYLSVVAVYALLLLSDVLFWNVFGFDQKAAQIYYLVPAGMGVVLRAKNIAALTCVVLEVTALALVCAALGFPVRLMNLLEAYSIALTMSLFLAGIGNLSSTSNPKPVDPTKSFRSSVGRQTQALLMFLFPVALTPVALAYLARYAFQTEAAFYGVLLAFALFGFALYSIASESAVATLETRKEAIIGALSGGGGPISS